MGFLLFCNESVNDCRDLLQRAEIGVTVSVSFGFPSLWEALYLPLGMDIRFMFSRSNTMSAISLGLSRSSLFSQ